MVGDQAGFPPDRVVTQDLDRLPDRIELHRPVVSALHQFAHESLDGQATMARRKPIDAGRRGSAAIGHLENGRCPCEGRDEREGRGIVAEVPQVQCQTHGGGIEPSDHRQGILEPRKETTAD